MLKKIVPVIVILAAAVIGGGGGVFAKLRLSPQDVTASEESSSEEEAAHHDDGAKKTQKTDRQDKAHGGDAHGPAPAARVFTFGRQFVVPVVENGRPRLMVLLDIGIEIDSSVDDGAYSREPMLRDAMLTEMLSLANEGVLGEIASDADALKRTKDDLLQPAKDYLGEGARRVLIQDMAVQPY